MIIIINNLGVRFTFLEHLENDLQLMAYYNITLLLIKFKKETNLWPGTF